MTANSRTKTGHFQPARRHSAGKMDSVIHCPAFPVVLPRLRLARAAAVVCALLADAHTTAQAGDSNLLPDALRGQVQRLAQDAARQVWGANQPAPRIEVEVGQLPAHLKLAPCTQVQPYLPAGTRALGRSRIGLRCLQGTARWNVSLPVTVRLWAPSLVAAAALPGGTVLEARHLATAEVDLAERTDPAIGSASGAIGRTLQRGLAAGDPVRQADLRTRQLFNAGDTVRIVATGAGFAISSEGQALGPGLEGQNTRVRTEGGRIVTGTATGERRVELPL